MIYFALSTDLFAVPFFFIRIAVLSWLSWVSWSSSELGFLLRYQVLSLLFLL